jgi:hypothetical protein
MNAPVHLSPTARARQEKRDLLMDALILAKRRADYDDWETYKEGEDDEVCLQTFAEVQWETVGCGIDPRDERREAIAVVTGARLGNILIDPDTLDAAFPGSVAKIEERLSEQFTRNGEWS